MSDTQQIITDIYGDFYAVDPENPKFLILHLTSVASVESRQKLLQSVIKENAGIPVIIVDPHGSIMCTHDLIGIGSIMPDPSRAKQPEPTVAELVPVIQR